MAAPEPAQNAENVRMTCDVVLFEIGDGMIVSCDRPKDHVGPHATFDCERFIVWFRDTAPSTVAHDSGIAAEIGVRFDPRLNRWVQDWPAHNDGSSANEGGGSVGA
jgi:hypothetical protein